MCGRYVLTRKEIELHKRFGIKPNRSQDEYTPTFNAAPTQALPVISSEQPDELQRYRWGLVPRWAESAAIGSKMINARAETLAEKASFKNLLASHRCLIPSDGFYEWQRSSKQPYCITLKDESIFAFAGLWDKWLDKSTGELIHTYTIITTAASAPLRKLHERMPVILTPETEKLWLTGELPQVEVLSLLQPRTDVRLYPVSPLVNSAAHNDPTLIEPAPLLQGELPLEMPPGKNPE